MDDLTLPAPMPSSKASLRRSPARRSVPLVYFIRHSDGPVKIGIAYDVAKRLKGLQTGHYADLTVLAVRTGGRKREMDYHARLKEHALRGEWFQASPEVLAEIAKINANYKYRKLLAEVASPSPSPLSEGAE